MTIKNNGQSIKNMQFRLYNMQWYDIVPNQFKLQPNEIKAITISLKRFDCQDDFIYLKGEQYD